MNDSTDIWGEDDPDDTGWEEHCSKENVDLIAERIKAGQKPNKKDIAYILKDPHALDIPMVIREYTAKLLLNEIDGKQMNSRIGKNGILNKYSGNDEKESQIVCENAFGCVGTYDALKKKGYDKESAFEIIAKATVLGILPEINSYSSNEDVKSRVEKIEKKWDEIPEDQIDVLDDKRSKEIIAISKFVYPRKRRSRAQKKA